VLYKRNQQQWDPTIRLNNAWRLYGETKDSFEFDVDDLIGASQRDVFCNPDGDTVYVMNDDGYLYEIYPD
jgi:hypothetical protein